MCTEGETDPNKEILSPSKVSKESVDKDKRVNFAPGKDLEEKLIVMDESYNLKKPLNKMSKKE